MNQVLDLKHSVRSGCAEDEKALINGGLHPLLAKLFAARNVQPSEAQKMGLADLLNPNQLLGIEQASEIIADALEAQATIVVVGDYDCDGATATAVAVRGLKMCLKAMGVNAELINQCIHFLVPNRFEYGYGLSPEIVQVAADKFQPDLIITVDNGIASVEGVQAANDLGIGVVVTDHHLPGEHLPNALAIVNPNQRGCAFESKAMAGVGVMFYTLLQTRVVLRDRGFFGVDSQPRLETLLDLVALGTIADVVKLDTNNRRLVAHGIRRIKSGKAQPGVLALFYEAGRDPRIATTMDMGFVLGPRLNAAGRLADMSLGIQCLLTEDPNQAMTLAHELDQMNQARKQIELTMKRDVSQELEQIQHETKTPDGQAGIVLAKPEWHEGVIGILASRVKETCWRPTIAMAPGENGFWKGSGRSIPGIHLRDVLDLVCKKLPVGAMPKFGGHAMAAGLSLKSEYLEAFKDAFNQAVAHFADEFILTRHVLSDGSVPVDYLNAATVDLLSQQVWGQGFPPPLFADEFEVLEQRLLKNAHSKFTLRRDGVRYVALFWNHVTPLSGNIYIAYRVERDTFTGGQAIQLVIEHVLS